LASATHRAEVLKKPPRATWATRNDYTNSSYRWDKAYCEAQATDADDSMLTVADAEFKPEHCRNLYM